MSQQFSEIFHESFQNSTTHPLLNGETFTGIAKHTPQYSSISILCYTDQPCSLYVQFSSDGVNFDFQEEYSIFSLVGKSIQLNTLSKWFRVVLQNNGGDMTVLRLDTLLSSVNRSTASVTQTSNTSISNLPTDTFGQLTTVGLVPFPKTQFNWSISKPQSLTTFVVPPVFGYDNILAEYDGGPTNSSYEISNNMLTLCDMSSSATFCRFLSTSIIPYRPGQGMYWRFTAKFITTNIQSLNSTKYIGCGVRNDPNLKDIYSGLFYKFDELTQQFGVCIFNNNVETAVYQSSWNEDKCDGSGKSGFIFDHSKINVFEIRVGYLGAANISFFIYNPNTSNFVLCHSFRYANSSLKPHLTMPSMGFFMQNNKEGTAYQILSGYGIACGSWGSFLTGAVSPTATDSHSCYDVRTIAAGVGSPVLAMQNLGTFLTKIARIPCKLTSISLTSDGTKSVQFQLYLLSSFSSATWIDVEPDSSPVQYSNNAVISSSGGLKLIVQLSKVDSKFINLDPLDLYINPESGMHVYALSSANSEVSVSLTWLEYH